VIKEAAYFFYIEQVFHVKCNCAKVQLLNRSRVTANDLLTAWLVYIGTVIYTKQPFKFKKNLMNKLIAAGLLMCRWQRNDLEYFLVHPGGPLFSKKDNGVWSVPKGLPEANEDLFQTALREFKEETGIDSCPPYFPLTPIKQKGGKSVYAWTFIGDWDESKGITSNLFEMEWPPKSGKKQSFPEQDKGAWFQLENAKVAIRDKQAALLEEAWSIHHANRK
jgi:predicted NUDIX family NTP pyrophosphohydrolase